MRTFGLAIVAATAITAASAAMAQSNNAQDKAQKQSVPLPQITIGGHQGTTGPAPEGNGSGQCGTPQAGSDQSFACLNQRLQSQVNAVNPTNPGAPIDASSSDLKVGTVNMSAVKQQYGRNFGVSAVPYRPAMTFGAAPMGGRH
jgi:hypothetical protein